MNRTIVFVTRAARRAFFLSLACALPLTAAHAAGPAQATELTRFVRAKPGGAPLFNLPDKSGAVVVRVDASSLLAVYAERAGYLDVEPAAGIEAWVFGQYVKSTNVPGIFEATGNNVLLRPAPASDEKSYPLGQRLNSGDRVRVIARADLSKPMKEDWLRISAPPGTRAWVQAADTIPIAAGEDSRALWAAAIKSAQAAVKPFDPAILGKPAAQAATAPVTVASGAVAAKTAATPSTAAAQSALEDAEKRMAAARAAAKPDYSGARAAYERVLEESSTGPQADTARRALQEIAAREELVRIKADAELAEGRRQTELSKADARLREASVRQDPLWGRFQARGWLERETRAGLPARYVVRWGSKVVAEVVCTSGRYDLATFAGYEVGLMGVTLRSAVAASDGSGDPMRVDATRIEVISGRASEH